MNRFEELVADSEKDNIILVEKHFKSKALGLCKGNKIGLSKTLTTTAEKACIFAEEYYGHYKTSVGNILDLKDMNNLKQEYIAHAKAIEKLCSLKQIVEAIKSGANDRYEIAEYLTVTDKFFDEAINYRRQKNGLVCKYEGLWIYFEPSFGILRDNIF